MDRAPTPDEQPSAARKEQIRSEQVRLLYANAGPGAIASACAVALVTVLQWDGVSRLASLTWLVYMFLVAVARYVVALRYRRGGTETGGAGAWGRAFAIGAGAAGAGWGAAGVLLFPENQITGQLFLAFVLGGMMLGGGSLLASRPEAFLAFLLPTGFPAAVWLLLHGDELHIAMGLLAAVFTAIICFTTWNNYQIITYSLRLRFENQDLLSDLQAAKEETEAMNRELERRVAERTEELRASTEKLKEEAEHRLRMEDELLRAQKLESLGVLAGGIAHDFNNFLAIVQGNVELARTRLRIGLTVDGVLEGIGAACERAKSLATQLLTFGKGGAPVRQVVSIAALLEEVAGLARAGSPVVIEVENAADLRAAQIDAAQVSHALHNILLNARQAMQDAGRISVRAENFENTGGSIPVQDGAYVKIAVRDTGCGIAPDILPKIFDPYFTTKPQGTGIGLAAAYAIVRKHAGIILVDTTVGEGSTFTLYLPATDQLPAAAVQTSMAPVKGAGAILIMDDEEPIRKLATAILEHLGYKAESAREGGEAIARYRESLAAGQPFRAVLMDLTIPGGMGGLEAAKHLREMDPHAKLIVSSGYSNAPVMAEYRQHGFDAVLPKPWTVAELSAVLRQIFGDS